MFQRFNLALGQERIEVEGQTSTRQHVIDCCADRNRKPHAAVFWVRTNANPASFGDGRKGLSETGGGAYDAVLQLCRVQITIALDGIDDLITELARFA